MAAGLLTIAHNSGGPKSDIVEPGITGYLAVTAEEYANAIHHALTLKDTTEMRRKAQASATRFSDQVFEISLKKVLPKLTCTRWYQAAGASVAKVSTFEGFFGFPINQNLQFTPKITPLDFFKVWVTQLRIAPLYFFFVLFFFPKCQGVSLLLSFVSWQYGNA